MDLTETFKNKVGNSEFIATREYICDNGLEEEFNRIKDDLEKLFDFSIKYGILELVKFLYEDINFIYNFNLITKHLYTSEEKDTIQNIIPVMNDVSANVGIKIRIIDKYSSKRESCLIYLNDMKKRSKLIIKDGNFYYKYNKKINL